MKHLFSTAAALSLLLASAVPSLAQTGETHNQPQVAPGAAAAPAPTPVIGVSTTDLAAWLTTQGATTEAVQIEGERRYMRVSTDGLPWILFFQSCEGDVCSDLQFSIGLTNTQVSAEKVNDWNRDRRFVKAIYEAPQGGEGASSALAQFDVLVPAGGPEEMSDQVAIWRNLIPEFLRIMSSSRTTSPVPATATPG